MQPATGVAVTPPDQKRRLRSTLITVGKWALILVALYYFTRLVRRIDWATVGHALSLLTAGQVVVLLVVVTARQVVQAFPLSLFVPGLGLGGAVANDLGGTTVAVVTPPPADIIVRMAMFTTWGVDVARGLAGLILNSIFYYVARLAAPVLGFLLAWAWLGYDPALAWPALTSGLVAVAIAVGLALSMRSPGAAAAAGRLAGRLVRKVRTTGPGPEDLERKFREFYENVSDRLYRTWPAAGLSMVVLLALEASVLVLSLRFVGVPPDLVTAVLIAASFLALYPLTALPFMGLGVLDATVITFIAHRSPADASELVAGLIVWRVAVQLVPMVFGAGALGWWRVRRRALAGPSTSPSAAAEVAE